MNISDVMRTFSSQRRMEVLDALLGGETRDEIRERVPSSTYAFTMDYLKKEGFVEGTGDNIGLTDIGRGSLVIFEQFRSGISVLQRLYAAFPDHTIDFPDEFLLRLGELTDSELVTSETSDVLKPHRIFFEYLSESKEIFGVSPLLFPDYVRMFRELAENDVEISLVVTDDIYGVISGNPILDFDNVGVYVLEDNPMIAATVSDQFLSLGFFYKSGNYDFTRDLISTSPVAIRFGRDLVEYYRTRCLKTE